MQNPILARLIEGNRRYLTAERNPGDYSPARRLDTAQNGQKPHTIVICCSDSRVVPESIFSAGLGELFVIRIAGNVLDTHQLGSIEYAAAHLGSGLILVLGHTGCGAVAAALSGHCEGYIRYIADEILLAAGDEREENAADYQALMALAEERQAVQETLDALYLRWEELAEEHPEIPSETLDVRGAIYDVESGAVEWL